MSNLHEIKQRWSEENRKNIPEMIFSEHARMDIIVLLRRIDALVEHVKKHG